MPTSGAEVVFAPLVPNPTTGGARITFTLPRPAAVDVTLLDIQGRAVAEIARDVFAAGTHQVAWDGTVRGNEARPGLYFVRLRHERGAVTRRLLVTR